MKRFTRRISVVLMVAALGSSCDDPVQPGGSVASVPTIVGNPIRPHTLGVGGSVSVDLSTYFEVLGDDSLSYAVASGSGDIVAAEIARSRLQVTGVAEGTDTLTITATLPGQGMVSQILVVSVKTNPDRDILVALYHATDGPNWRIKTNWLTDAPLGTWYGVATDSTGRVVRLDLGWNQWLRFRTPGLRGAIPAEIGGLAHLTYLDLSSNWNITAIPPEIGNLSQLTRLYLSRNKIAVIPSELGKLSRLKHLGLGFNLISALPPEIGNLSSLTWLDMTKTTLARLPPTIGNLHSLTNLSFPANSVDALPSSIGNLRNLEILNAHNNAIAAIPPEIGALRKLREFMVGRNPLTEIPPEIGNLTSLEFLNLSETLLTEVPEELGRLTKAKIWLHESRLISIPSSLGRVPIVSLRSNQIAVLPPDFEAIWEGVYMDYNQLVSIPKNAFMSSDKIKLRGNRLTSVPSGLGSATRIDLAGNQLTTIPPELGNAAHLDLSYNNLIAIPPEIANADTLLLDGNQLEDLPPGAPMRVRVLSLRSNKLVHIPAALASAHNLEVLDLSYNPMAGPIPPELAKLTRLRKLTVEGASLTGSIPLEFLKLTSLQSLTLRNNALTGDIPMGLREMNPLALDLRSNGFTGVLPFRPAGAAWIYDNAGLCAGPDWRWSGALRNESGSLNSGDSYCDNEDRNILISLYDRAGGSDWDKSWSSEINNLLNGPSSTISLHGLHGVSIDSVSGHVVSLSLSDNGLKGTLSEALGELNALRSLDVSDNPELVGRLPNALAGAPLDSLNYGGTGLCTPPEPAFRAWLDSLSFVAGTSTVCEPYDDREVVAAICDRTPGTGLCTRIGEEDGDIVELEITAMKGAIPSELGDLRNLRKLRLAGEFSGDLPSRIRELRALESLEVMGPVASGTLGIVAPRWIGELQRLRELKLVRTNYKGAIPSEWSNLDSLMVLDLHANRLTGRLPSWLPRLEYLRLSSNDFRGSIHSVSGTGRIQSLILSDNKLSGDIGVFQFGHHLREIDLENNRFTGSVPPSLGRLPELAVLNLAANDLSGLLPATFGSSDALRRLNLRENRRLFGPLPHTMTRLPRLGYLNTSDTDLCAPTDAGFKAWLEGRIQVIVQYCQASAYLTQGVQDLEMSVPLVAGRDALLRVFPQAHMPSHTTIPGARATFFLAGSPVFETDMPGNGNPIPTRIDEGWKDGSLNVRIPGKFIQPGLEMVVEIDPDGTLDPALGVSTRVPAEGRQELDVSELPPLNLVLVPCCGAEEPQVVATIAEMARDPAGHPGLAEVRTLLPIGELNVATHEPITCPYGEEIHCIAAVRASEGHDARSGPYYMAVYSQGRYGIARQAGRISYAPLGNPMIMAHELGHNLNLSHAPCGVYVNLDPNYPYEGGVTNTWGFDFADDNVIPPYSTDVMGYCSERRWISDYHFRRAFRFRASQPDMLQATAPPPSLLLWGGVSSDGHPFLKPAFGMDVAATSPVDFGPHRIAGHDGGGQELFNVSFDMAEIADGEDIPAWHFAFMLPVHADVFGKLASITLTTPGGTAILDESIHTPMTILKNVDSGQIRAILDGPFNQADASEIAPGIRLEAITSRGLPVWPPS